MKVRFKKHKSHIKHCRKTYEESSHFTDKPSIHNIDPSNNNSFTQTLSSELKIIIIDQVSKIANDGQNILSERKNRECFW